MTDHVAGLTSTGLPLPSGVRALGEELPGRRLRAVLDRLAGHLESGLSLEEALGRLGNRLPPHLRGLVLAGTRTGKLGEVLGRFAGYANIGVDLRRSLWMRLAYPIFTLFMAAAVFVLVCVVLVSGFSQVFQEFGVQVPLFTRFVFTIADAVGNVWMELLQAALGLAAFGLLAALVLRPEFRRSLAWSIPLIGPVWQLSDLAEFSHLLALLIASDVPLVEALPMAGAAVRNSEIDSGTKQAAREVAEGRPLAQALSRPSLFPRGFSRFIEWAETHRGLPEALHLAGEMFEARARTQATFVSTVCSILAVLSILGGIATIILAVLIPMFQMLNKLMG